MVRPKLAASIRDTPSITCPMHRKGEADGSKLWDGLVGLGCFHNLALDGIGRPTPDVQITYPLKQGK